MPNANRSKFVLNDIFILSDKEELDKENLEQSLLQNGEAFDLSIVPKLDSPTGSLSFSDDHKDALNERSGNEYNPNNKVDRSSITFYNGGSALGGEKYKTDTRIPSGAKDNHKSKIDGDLDQGRSGRHIREFSQKAQRAMRTELCRINVEHLEGTNRPLFVTLTVADDVEGEGMTDKCQSSLKRFKKKLARHPTYKELCGMWKWEFQKNNKPHAHMILWGVPFVSHEWLAETWHESLYPDPEIREKNKKHLEAGSSIGKIHGVSRLKKISKSDFNEGKVEAGWDENKNKLKHKKQLKRVGGKNGAFKKSVNYLTKYLTKDYTNIPEDWKSARFYGYINMEKFKSYQEPVVIETTDEQYETISKATTKVLNNRKRHVVHNSVQKGGKLKYIMMYGSNNIPVTAETDEYGFSIAIDEAGVPLLEDVLDSRKFIGGGSDSYEIKYDDQYDSDDDNDFYEEHGMTLVPPAYVTELVMNVYTTKPVTNKRGREEWVDTLFGVLTEHREFKPDAFITMEVDGKKSEFINPKYIFKCHYNSKYVLTNNDGEVVTEYSDFKDFEGIKLASESQVYNQWSVYGVDIKEVLELAYPDCNFELKGSYVTSLDKYNNIKERKLICTLHTHEQEQMMLEKAS